MSYDLYLVRATNEADALRAARHPPESEGEAPNIGPIVPEAEAWKTRLVQALQKVNPTLEPFVFDHAEIARLQNIAEAAAREQWRHVELNGPAGGNGIQLTIFDDSASVTAPCWHRGDAARAVFREIWRYLEALTREGGLWVYDPQLDRILSLEADFEAVVGAYAAAMAFTDQVVARVGEREKPWWKIW
jgi:hypothetical protein